MSIVKVRVVNPEGVAVGEPYEVDDEHPNTKSLLAEKKIKLVTGEPTPTVTPPPPAPKPITYEPPSVEQPKKGFFGNTKK